MVLSWEERLAFKHLCKNATCTPNIDSHIVLLPGEHDFGGTVISCADVTGHLGVLDTGKTKVADLQIAVLVDENVAWLQVTVDDTGRVNVLETSEDLVQEVLNELLLEWTAGEQSVEISAEELGDKVTVRVKIEKAAEKMDWCVSCNTLRKTASWCAGKSYAAWLAKGSIGC